jgi:peptide/nickel transport system ATP-binding protein
MYYATSGGDVKAVDGVSFDVEKGEVLAIAGESGCGKSSLAWTLIKVLPPNAKILEGRIGIDGLDITKMRETDVRRRIRWKKIAMIPQAAMNAMNPVFRVGDQIAEVISLHTGDSKEKAREKARQLLALVGVDPNRASYYPHEFSGGMKQRAMIAMSVALNPSLLIADEPTTALDVIVQAGIIKVLLTLREKYDMSIILISHDLALIAQLTDKTAIMYAGKFVEYGKGTEVYHDPLHPYTLGLLAAFADIRKQKAKLVSIPGAPPDLVAPPPACRFHPRCLYAQQICREKEPPLEEAKPGHFVACHFWREISAKKGTKNEG